MGLLDNISIVQVPIPASNFTYGRAQPISGIVPHHAVIAYLGGVDATFLNPYRAGSTHYGIEGRTIHQYMSEGDTSWANSDWYANCSTITWEMCNSSTDYPYPISDETIDTAARLGADILIRYKLGRAVHGQTVHMHREYVATQCPGDYFALQYGLQRYCDLVNKYIDGGKDMQGQVITWDLHKGDNQQWARVVRGDHIALVNRATQKVLDVNGESTEQGTLAIIWDEKKPEPSLNQLWKEETVIVDGAQFLRYRSALTGFVLDAKGAGYADGTPAILWPENGQLNQCWIKVPTDDGWFVLLNANSGDALDAIL